jgi:hypothetical protein
VLQGAPFRRPHHPERDLLDLLIFEQPPHEFRPRIFPGVVVGASRQEELRLQAQESARHLQIIRRLIQPELMDRLEELIRNARHGNVRDVDALLAHEVQQEVERSREALEVHHEPLRARRGCSRGLV